MPMRARKPLSEDPEPEMPVPVFGAIGVLSAPGPGVLSPATALSGVVGAAVAGAGVFVGATGVLVGRTGVLVGVSVGVLRISGVQFVQSCVTVGVEALVFITQTSVSCPVVTVAVTALPADLL